MTKKWHQDPAFLAERKKWYAKLKKEGFEDIELHNWTTGEAYERTMGVSSADVCNTWSPGKERYYQLASQYLWELRRIARNERAKERRSGDRGKVRWGRVLRVWKCHADGLSIRATASKLSLARSSVHEIVKEYAKKMEEWYMESERE